ncbi:MAG: DNA repair exonuclease [Pyrobaculum sp.]
MKILHLSDAHLGRAQYGLAERAEDYFNAFEEALRLGKSADVVLATGDLFDSRQVPVRRLMRFIDVVEAAGVRLYVIGGNHDFSYLAYRSDRYHTVLSLLDRLGLVQLLCWKEAEVGGVYIYGACATPREHVAEYRAYLQRMPPGSILAIHQAIEGVRARYPTESDDFTMPQKVFQGLPYVHIAAGHVHDHYVSHPVGAVWAGSLELWDAGEFETWDFDGRWERGQEAAGKGVVLIDVAGRGVVHKSLLLSRRRPMYRVRLHVGGREIHPAVEEAARRFDRSGAVVRLEIYGSAEGVRLGELAAYFPKALHVEVVDKTSAPRRAVELRGPAMGEVMRFLKERLGEHGEVVLKAMEYLRDGDREAAERLLAGVLYDKEG